MTQRIYVGVDLGGTSIKVGLCDEEGKLIQTYEGPTGAEHGPDFVLDRIVEYVHRIVDESPYEWEQVAGIGAGIAGFMDIPTGFVELSPNLGWRNVAVKKTLEEKLGKTVKIDNDANVAALGEAWGGAGRGIPNLVCYTLGTGVGGGIIINGKFTKVSMGWQASSDICPLFRILKRLPATADNPDVWKRSLPPRVSSEWPTMPKSAATVRVWR